MWISREINLIILFRYSNKTARRIKILFITIIHEFPIILIILLRSQQFLFNSQKFPRRKRIARSNVFQNRDQKIPTNCNSNNELINLLGLGFTGDFNQIKENFAKRCIIYKRYQWQRDINHEDIRGFQGPRESRADGDGLGIQVTAFKAIDYNQRRDRPGSEIHTAFENQSSYDILMITGKKKCHGC